VRSSSLPLLLFGENTVGKKTHFSSVKWTEAVKEAMYEGEKEVIDRL